MAVFQLDDDLWFPDPRLGDPDGLVAVGGDLSADRLLLAYSHGFFPWSDFRRRPQHQWFCPMRRFVIFPPEIHVSHSMRQLIKQGKYHVTVNRCFDAVIRGCASADGRMGQRGAWLGPAMIEAYTELHRLGYAASVEVWEPSATGAEASLVGGLYGVALANAFFGESMFSLVPNASKLALIHLARTLSALGASLIDCQMETPHLRSMGGRYISYDRYMALLRGEGQK